MCYKYIDTSTTTFAPAKDHKVISYQSQVTVIPGRRSSSPSPIGGAEPHHAPRLGGCPSSRAIRQVPNTTTPTTTLWTRLTTSQTLHEHEQLHITSHSVCLRTSISRTSETANSVSRTSHRRHTRSCLRGRRSCSRCASSSGRPEIVCD